jgi:N-acetylglutamate synthase-like GNAT family acetyltransferase
MAVTVRVLQVGDASACDAILLTLPDFFGHEGGRLACSEAVRTRDGLVAEESGGVVGFLTWEQRTESTIEITWMAVRRDRRHEGIGTRIVEALLVEARRRGSALVLAMTSAGPKHDNLAGVEDTYAPTRRFWAARGFLPLIELDIWDVDRALLLVRPLTPG